MSVRDLVLETFERNRGRFISGEEIAEKLGVSRASVWKAVQKLRNEGFPIEAGTNKGYAFMENDILSAAGIKPYLQGAWQIEVLKTVDSTNTAARQSAQKGAPDRTVVVAEEQTGGRGRKGKSFYSPGGTGIYFSVLLRPKISLSDATVITCQVAVAVARAIEKCSNIIAQIKWVNDVYINGKKVCGILTEAASDLESGSVEFIIIGIGVNVSTIFPAELKEIATALPGNVGRNQLLAEILNQLDIALLENVMIEYKKRSCVLGKQIKILYGDRTEIATALDIDKDGHLIVRDSFGNLKVMCSGEISVKVT